MNKDWWLGRTPEQQERKAQARERRAELVEKLRTTKVGDQAYEYKTKRFAYSSLAFVVKANAAKLDRLLADGWEITAKTERRRGFFHRKTDITYVLRREVK